MRKLAHQKQLLKFNAPSDYALSNLESGTIFCQRYDAYNDPFEFWTEIVRGIPDADRDPERFLAALKAWGFNFGTVSEALNEPVVRENAQEYFEECELYAPPFEDMRQSVRIACFASQNDNLLMWSHYADGLRGFCVVFDEDSLLKGKGEAHVLDVAYSDKPPKVDSFIYGIAYDQEWFSQTAIDETMAVVMHLGESDRAAAIADYEEAGAEAVETMRDLWQRVFATKPQEWRYEGERRLLIQTDKVDAAPLLWTYEREAVREVILGERMSEDYRARVLSVLEKLHPGVPVTTARRAQNSYAVVVN